MPRPVDEARRDRAREMYAKGCTEREIAGALSASTSTVRRWLAGAEKRRTGPRGRTDVADETVISLRDEGLSFEQAAQDAGMSKTGFRLRYGKLTGQRRPDRPARPETPPSAAR